MSAGLMEEGFYLLVNFGYLLGAIPVLVAGIMVLRAGHKFAGATLVTGGALVVVEMLFWIADSLIAFIRSGSTYDTIMTDGIYLFLSALGAVGTMTIGAGILLLALLFRASWKENRQLHGLVRSDGADRS